MQLIQIENPVAWLGLLLIVPLIAIFMIKAGYRRQTVSTTMFWDDVRSPTRLALWGTRLRGSIAFVLACCFVMLLIVAILNPVSTGDTTLDAARLNPDLQNQDNIAITRCEARRQTLNPKEYELMLEAVNRGPGRVTPSLTVELDGIPIHVSRWVLDPDKPATKFIHAVAEHGGTIRAELEHNKLTDNGRSVDCVAETVLPACEYTNVLCYGVSDPFLLRAFQSQLLVTAKKIDSLSERVPPNSIVVIQGRLPQRIPEGNVFIVEPNGRCDLFTVGDAITHPVVGNIAADSALTRFVSLMDMHIPGALKIIPKKTGDIPETLIRTTGGDPLLLQWNRDSGRVIVFPAKPSQGEFVFRVAFPLMIANIINSCRHTSNSNDGFRFTSSLVDRLEHGHVHDSLGNTPGTKHAAYTTSQALQDHSKQPLWFYFGWLALVVSIMEWIFYHRRVIQ